MMIGLAGGSNEYLSPQFNPMRTVNMYVVRDPNSKWGSGLVSLPGSKKVSENFAAGASRGQFAIDSLSVPYMYLVQGNKVYRYNSTMTSTPLSTNLFTKGGYVGIDTNQTKIVFVDGLRAYESTIGSTTLSPISLPAGLTRPVDITNLDGRLLIADGDSNKFYCSGLETTTFDTTNFVRLTTNPETLVGIREKKRRIFVFGKQTIEVWFNSFSPGFPFSRDNNQVYNFGAVSAASIADSQDFLIWLCDEQNGNPTVRLTDGGSIKKVSTDSIEKRLQSLTNLKDCQAYVQKINGHIFCFFSFTKDNLTLVYDIAVDEWTEASMSDGSRYFGATHAYFEGKHYVGHYKEPILYEVSDQYYSNDGDNIHCLVIPKTILTDDLHPIEIARCEIDAVVGTGLNNTNYNYANNDVAPQVYLSTSMDGGYTFGNSVLASVGKIGQFRRRLVYPPMGIYEKGCVVKIEHFNRTPLILMGMDVLASKVGY